MALTWTPPQPASFSTCRLQVSGPAFFSASHPVGIILPPGPVALNEPPTESKFPSLVLLQLCFGRFLLLPRNHLQGFESLVLIICQCVTSPGPASSTELMTHKVMPAMVRSIPATASAESRRGVWGWKLEGMGEKSKWSKAAAVAFPSAFEIKIKTSVKVLFHPGLLSTKVGRHIHIFQQFSCLPVALTSQWLKHHFLLFRGKRNTSLPASFYTIWCCCFVFLTALFSILMPLNGTCSTDIYHIFI